VNISQQTVTVFLDEDGRAVMELAAVTLAGSGLSIYVQDTDDIGIWARIGREDGEHICFNSMGLCSFSRFSGWSD
jgi:hypothetical protein